MTIFPDDIRRLRSWLDFDHSFTEFMSLCEFRETIFFAIWSPILEGSFITFLCVESQEGGNWSYKFILFSIFEFLKFLVDSW